MTSYLISGPCAAESQSQLRAAAHSFIELTERLRSEGRFAGVRAVFRAGAWKPRTKPGCFEGHGEEALKWLAGIQHDYRIDTATEVATPEQASLALKYGIRCWWLGARTTTNPFLVQQIADILSGYEHERPLVLVKNPVSPDLMLWQGAIERMEQAVGKGRVVAVHRGFTSAAPHSLLRNAPKWSLALSLKSARPDVPLLLDPSHMAGNTAAIPLLCRQAMELAYDGLMIEMHPHPEEALSDADQQLAPSQLLEVLRSLPEVRGREESAADNAKQTTVSTMLAEYRVQIDEIDDELWQLLLRRTELSREIGDYKKAHHLSVLQPERWQSIVAKRLAWAENNGLSEETTMRILDAIHDESRRHQNN